MASMAKVDSRPRSPRREREKQQRRPASYRDGADEQPQQNQVPIYDGWHAFPGYYFDPSAAATANDIKGLVGAFTALPNFLYFSVLLFLPFVYRKRVHQIFNGVHLTQNEMASHYLGGPPAGSWRPKRWEEVERSWSDFIDSTLKEWSTLNIVSVLLLSAIYNLLQLDGSGSRLVQCTALMSLISALASLFFGSLYVNRFETMRKPHKAMQLAQSALHPSSNTWWNLFVLLSLPFVWLAWSIILFIICLMSVIWKTSGQPTNTQAANCNCFQIPRSLDFEIDVKIITSAFLFIGFLHFYLILTTFSQYSDIDEAWSDRITQMIQAAALVNGHVPGVSGPPTSEQHRALPSIPISPFAGPHRPSASYPPARTAVTQEKSMDSETRPSTARHRHARRGRRGRHRDRYSEDSSEESEPMPSSSRHKDEPTKARHHYREYIEPRPPTVHEEAPRRYPSGRSAPVRRSPTIVVEPRRPSPEPAVELSPIIYEEPPRRPPSRSSTPVRWSPRTSEEAPRRPSPEPPVERSPTLYVPSRRPHPPPTVQVPPRPQTLVEPVMDIPQDVGNTSGGNDDQWHDAESRQSDHAPRSLRDTSDDVSLLEGESSTLQPEDPQNMG